MKKLLIIGAGGFLGANACGYFSSNGYEVFAASRNPKDSWRLSLINCRKISLDVTSLSSCKSTISSSNPDAIINFAAYGAYPGVQTDPSLMKKTNLLGVKNLLECASECSIPHFIQIGSSSEYGHNDSPMAESDICNPKDDYAKTKLQATMLALQDWGNTKTTVIRPFSPFGEFEESRRLIPTLILSALSNLPAKLSSPYSMRDFMYVKNFNHGLELALNSNSINGEIFNLSQGSQMSVGQIAELVQGLIPSSPSPLFNSIQNPRNEPKMWQADTSKAKKILGWEPTISPKEGLKKTIVWFKSNRKFYLQ
ncbi:MAG: NAD(P)-dependent oxidoreductase [Candidatus Micrarchaeia archaeon]